VEQLWANRPFEEATSLRILDLCNELLAEVQVRCESREEGLSEQDIGKVEILLEQEAGLKRKSLYARLITLHPRPRKELLLPYIEDSALSIVCINLLLGSDKLTAEASRPRGFSATKSRYSPDSVHRSGSIA
jgi:hypothetical protein